MSWIYRHIYALQTPCGTITVTDGNGTPCPFSVRPNPYCPDYRLFYGTEQEEVVNPDASYLICIQISGLTIGHTYKLSLAGCQLHFGGSDEHTESLVGTSNGFSIAIGSYDPNDDEKIRQAYEYSKKLGILSQRKLASPPQYDKSRFVHYEIGQLENCSGFWFCLLDDLRPEISFPVAWLKNNYEGLFDYEDAVDFWTT